MRTRFTMFTTVQIAHLLTPMRELLNAGQLLRQPVVGEKGTIVEIFGGLDEATYLVEHLDAQGRPEWVAEFVADELQLVPT